MIKQLTQAIAGLALTGLFALATIAQASAPAKPAEMAKPTAKAKAATTSKSDAEIQADIQKRLAAAPHLKTENIGVNVAGGIATFTGMVKSAGSKGGVSSLAKAAGAKSVVNNILVEKTAKLAPTPKPAATPKPATMANPAPAPSKP